MSTQVVYLAFGPRKDLYRQIYFSVRSLQFWRNSNVGVTIITDNPAAIRGIEETVEVEHISIERIEEWKGELNFLWRAKMKAIEHATSMYPEKNVLYVDSDTVFAKDISWMLDELDRGEKFMHVFERNIASSKNSYWKTLYNDLSGFNHESYVFNAKTSMFNAGVIGLPKGRAQQLAKAAVDVCDGLCRTSADRTLLEQLAFSMVLSQTELKTAEQTIIHYWGNKPQWDALINEFGATSLLENRTLQEELSAIEDIDFEKIPSFYRERRMVRKLSNWLNRSICKPKVQYLD
ncbi:hypothetical protein DBZ36_00470 [Alginatibacterium sediminis]|uniref:Nucleotide-diphospho-sugar transferase domain-containing protein n=1 Tax=Alginatibacterium sediminis TaxID=2164068 RepID=A0A420ENI3_9ALTE|nr:hypothetical protein [Alginatibacterium sediminis]RKF22154.1 hypothetical protein DBZ36_00470 [Alginatibacterium sediminis]